MVEYYLVKLRRCSALRSVSISLVEKYCHLCAKGKGIYRSHLCSATSHILQQQQRFYVKDNGRTAYKPQSKSAPTD